MPEDFSPEERLLRLIKGKKNNKDKEKELPLTAEMKPVPAGTPLSTEKDQLQQRSDLQKGPAITKIPKPGIYNVRRIPQHSRFMYIGFGILVLIIAALFTFGAFSNKESKELSNLEKMIAEISKGEKEKAQGPGEQPQESAVTGQATPRNETQPEPESTFEDYQQMLRAKEIFSPAIKEKTTAIAPAGSILRDMTKDLKLVGIIPGDEPQAIIEDKRNGQTLFLKQEERIDGIEIKEISNGKVILGYQDETVILSM